MQQWRKMMMFCGMFGSRHFWGGMLAAILAVPTHADTLEFQGMFPDSLVVRPLARDPELPAARWDDVDDGALWTRVALSAFEYNAPGLTDVIPRDIETWCPAYVDADEDQRRAFWVGMMSTLSYHESHFRPAAVGGGNQWFGLLQIYPPTARGYECRARTGTALTDPANNLSCATRIMAVTVPRDEAVAIHDGRWRGVAADWGPMVSRTKRADMIEWTRAQNYCIPQDLLSVPRPPARPDTLASNEPGGPLTLDAETLVSEN